MQDNECIQNSRSTWDEIISDTGNAKLHVQPQLGELKIDKKIIPYLFFFNLVSRIWALI